MPNAVSHNVDGCDICNIYVISKAKCRANVELNVAKWYDMLPNNARTPRRESTFGRV
jgi:hypothetical protein